MGDAVPLMAACFLLFYLPQAQAQQPAPSSAAQSPPAVQAIPGSEVALRADDLQRVLRRVESQLAARPTVQDINNEINRRGRRLHVSALETDEMLSGTPRLIGLREQDRYWFAEADSATRFQEQLAGRAAALERLARSLDRLQAAWGATRAQVQTESELEPLAERIEGALAAIAATKSHVQSELDQLVASQTRVAEQQSLASEMVDGIEAAIAKYRRQLFERLSPPIWEAPWRQESAHRRGVLGFWRLASGHVEEFFRRASLGLAGLGVLFVVILAAAVTVRRKATAWIEQARIPEVSARILKRPYSLALMLTLAPALPVLFQSPVAFNALVFFLLLLATIRQIPLVIGPGFQPFLYLVLGLLLMVTVRPGVLPPFLERTLYGVSCLAAIGVTVWLIRRARVSGPNPQTQGGRRLLLIARLGVALFGLCLLLNLIGYFALAWTLQDAGLSVTTFGIVLYIAFRAAVIFISVLLQSDSARSVATIRLHEKEILRWVKPILAVVAWVFWLGITLDILTLRIQALNMVSQALNSSFDVGKASVSPRGILTFVLVLVAGFVLAKVVRFFLLEDVLSRVNMERGLPDAISTTVYYLLVVGVFVLALASAGIELSQFNILTGAFGLGIGFGLQTVVNNFVSGLILKYERRINVRDIVDVSIPGAGVQGTVQKVGIRASIIATSDGAEAIVPNSVLVTNQVLNWTLSSPMRRAVLPVGVVYGTDPKRVIALLVEVASSHPDVMHEPAPSASFLGFGDKALNFELSFWTPTVKVFGRVKSEVAIGVYESLEKAGIEIRPK